MKSKFLCLTQISLLCASLFAFGCNKAEEQSSSYREVSYLEFKMAAKNAEIISKPYTAAEILFYDNVLYVSDKPIYYHDNFLFVNNEWKSHYSIPFEQNVLKFFSYSAFNILEYVEQDYDSAYFYFYLSNDGFYAIADYYDLYAEAKFNMYGQLISLNVTVFDEYYNVNGSTIVNIDYYVDAEKIVDTETLAVKDMLIVYQEQDDSYHFVGFNQHIRPKKIKIPDSYNDEVHGKKDVVDIDMYSIVRNSCVETLELGYNVSTINFQANYADQCGLKEIVANNPQYVSIDGVLYSNNKTELIMFPPKKDCKNYVVEAETTIIKEYSFFNCKGLKNIYLGNNLELVEYNAFVFCGIESLEFPLSIRHLSMCCISNCPFLKKVSINCCLDILHSGLIIRCENLLEITIGASVQTISKEFVIGCPLLSTINYLGTINEWNNIVFIRELDSSTGDVLVECSDGSTYFI